MAGTVLKCSTNINSFKFYRLEKQISKKQTILKETFSQKSLDKENCDISTKDIQKLRNAPPFPTVGTLFPGGGGTWTLASLA